MSEIIQEYSDVFAAEGRDYIVRAIGLQRDANSWIGFFRFVDKVSGQSYDTPPETTQPNREALLYWASGIEPVYFDGAWERARAAAATSP